MSWAGIWRETESLESGSVGSEMKKLGGCCVGLLGSSPSLGLQAEQI